jgi:hypothetical protein
LIIDDSAKERNMESLDAARKRDFSYRNHIIATGVFVVLVGIGSLGVWLLDYIGGLHNSPGLTFPIPTPAFILGPLALLTLAFTVHGFFALFAKPRSLKHAVLRLFFVVIPPLTFLFGAPVVFRILPHPFLLGFGGWVAKNVDTTAIQEWLATEGHKYSSNTYYYPGKFPAEFPKYLVDFDPSWIMIGAEREGEVTADFHWGSALAGHWDIVVGPPTMQMPKSGRVGLGNGYEQFRRPVKPGVYVTWSD